MIIPPDAEDMDLNVLFYKTYRILWKMVNAIIAMEMTFYSKKEITLILILIIKHIADPLNTLYIYNYQFLSKDYNQFN